MPGCSTSSLSISNCEAPVATMILASPRSAIARRMCSAPAVAAAFPICALSDIILMSIAVYPPRSGIRKNSDEVRDAEFSRIQLQIMNAPSGYVDLQVNGYADVDFNADELSSERVSAVCKRLRDEGVAGILATIITADLDAMCRRLANICR